MTFKKALTIYKQHWDIFLLLYFLGYFPFFMLDLVLHQTLVNQNLHDVSLLDYVYPHAWDFMPWTLAALPLTIYLSAYLNGQSYTFMDYVILWFKHVWAILLMLLVASYFFMSIQQVILIFFEEWLASGFFQTLIQNVLFDMLNIVIVSFVFIPLITLSIYAMEPSHAERSLFKRYAFWIQSSPKNIKTVIAILLTIVVAEGLLIVIRDVMIVIIVFLHLPHVIYYLAYVLAATFIYSGSILIIYTAALKWKDHAIPFKKEGSAIIYE
ncbi:MAG: hypothetical protein IMX04_02825 [Candidatus Carbobacillus altaicus]|nr:hypothetical protein [Candidatus Carbobacillus altaicus]